MSSYDSLLTIIRDEADTIVKYRELLEDTECPECIRLINHIIEEEVEHIGEAMYMLQRISPDFKNAYVDGGYEADALIHSHEPMLDT